MFVKMGKNIVYFRYWFIASKIRSKFSRWILEKREF